jgi:hypothetical protein
MSEFLLSQGRKPRIIERSPCCNFADHVREGFHHLSKTDAAAQLSMFGDRHERPSGFLKDWRSSSRFRYIVSAHDTLNRPAGYPKQLTFLVVTEVHTSAFHALSVKNLSNYEVRFK